MTKRAGCELPLLAGNDIHNALNEYNNFGTINGVMYATDGDAII